MKTEEYKREAERQSERVPEKMKEWEEIDAADRVAARNNRRRKRVGHDADLVKSQSLL